MIRRVTVKRFRAFEKEVFRFDEGTTFVVAPNGGGKTTLTRAVSWALFGEHSGVDAKGGVRGDGPAEVTVELTLTDQTAGWITRTQPKRGRAKLEAMIGETSTTDDVELASLLSSHWAASPQHLARICFLEEHSVARRSRLAPGLDDHLHSIFGLDRLRADRDQAKKVRLSAERDVTASKKAAQRPEEARRQDRERLASLQEQLDEAERRREQIQRRSHEVRAQAELRARWATFDERDGERQAGLSRLVGPVEEVTGVRSRSDEASLRSVLSEAESQLRDELDAHQRAIGILEGRLEAAEAALQELRSADAECPVCLRPLSEDEAEHALAGHTERRAGLEAELARLRAKSESEQYLGQLRQLQAELDNLPDPLAPSEPRPEHHDAVAGDEFGASLEDVTSQIVELKETIATVQRRLSDDDEILETQREMQRALHRLAVAQVAEEAFAETIDIVTQEQVGPLSTAMEAGWKALMGGQSSLSWELDRASLKVGSHIVDFAEASGGERTIVTIMTQLLAIAASTEAKFLWLDEPLEHLDPDHRRLVAAALAAAVNDGAVHQIVVTTYEEPLVRRLRHAFPDTVHLRYLVPSADGPSSE